MKSATTSGPLVLTSQPREDSRMESKSSSSLDGATSEETAVASPVEQIESRAFPSLLYRSASAGDIMKPSIPVRQSLPRQSLDNIFRQRPSLKILPDSNPAESLVNRKNRRGSLQRGRKSIINLGAVVEFSRFSFEQLEIRDTDDESVFGQNNSTNTIVGKVPIGQRFYFRASDATVDWLRRVSNVLFVWNCFFTTFYVMFYPLLVASDGVADTSTYPRRALVWDHHYSSSSLANNGRLREERELADSGETSSTTNHVVLQDNWLAERSRRDAVSNASKSPSSRKGLKRDVGVFPSSTAQSLSPPRRNLLAGAGASSRNLTFSHSRAREVVGSPATRSSTEIHDHYQTDVEVSKINLGQSATGAKQHETTMSRSGAEDLPRRRRRYASNSGIDLDARLRLLSSNSGSSSTSKTDAAVVTVCLVDLLVFELLFTLIHIIMPLRTSVVLYQQGKEYVEMQDIKRLVLSQHEYKWDIFSMSSSFMWLSLVAGGGWAPFRFLGLLRLCRFESVKKYMRDKQCMPDGRVLSPWRSGLFSAMELALINFFAVHIFAVIWFMVVHRADGQYVFELDTEETDVMTYYLLSLRDAVLLFSASPPASMTARQDMPLVATQVLLKPVGALCQAVIFAEIVLIKQRMNILKSKILEQQTTINAAMSVLRLPENLRRRITMYHQFLEIQHDEQACKLLYHTSSRALVLEVKICLFAQLIEKAPLFYDLKPHGVGEIIDSFQEEVFSPGDFIIREGQNGREMYFILKGQCDVLINTNKTLAASGGAPPPGTGGSQSTTAPAPGGAVKGAGAGKDGMKSPRSCGGDVESKKASKTSSAAGSSIPNLASIIAGTGTGGNKTMSATSLLADAVAGLTRGAVGQGGGGGGTATSPTGNRSPTISRENASAESLERTGAEPVPAALGTNLPGSTVTNLHGETTPPRLFNGTASINTLLGSANTTCGVAGSSRNNEGSPRSPPGSSNGGASPADPLCLEQDSSSSEDAGGDSGASPRSQSPGGSKKSRKKLVVVAQKHEGDYFGEIALVKKGAKRTAYIRAQTYSVVEKLTDEVFVDLIQNKHPLAYEKIVARIAKFHNIPHESPVANSRKSSRAPSKDAQRRTGGSK
ncbi:unnamed protein product [Amoebophrya sp. A25]|nr:unnamed protein product [Amoebophrya sp. A25]|eukprot:GSA25T00023684001.1